MGESFSAMMAVSDCQSVFILIDPTSLALVGYLVRRTKKTKSSMICVGKMPVYDRSRQTEGDYVSNDFFGGFSRENRCPFSFYFVEEDGGLQLFSG